MSKTFRVLPYISRRIESAPSEEDSFLLPTFCSTSILLSDALLQLVNIAVKTLDGSLEHGRQRCLLVAQPAHFGNLKYPKCLVNGEFTSI
jgi:hypothetical protein